MWTNSARNTESQATPDNSSPGIKKRRSACSAFFYACLLAILPGSTAFAADNTCRTDNFDEQVAVRYIVDGDTLHLKDGRKVRLIGINTPELRRHGRAAQPYADKARQHLRQLIADNPRIALVHDVEATDKYHRSLAHGFLTDGTNLQAQLLAQGLATSLVIPPSLKFVDCYKQQEKLARAQQRGIWALAAYQTIKLDRSTKPATGFRRIRGRIQWVANSKSAIWINFQAPFALRIDHADLDYFAGLDLNSLTGRLVVVQGWVYHRKGQARMTLRHPAQLHFYPNETNNDD